MINYIEKSPRMHDAIVAAGYWLRQYDRVWVSSDDTAVQAIIDNYDPLPDAKKDAKQRIKKEASNRTAEIYPNSDPKLAVDLYLSIKPEARKPLSGDLLLFKEIYEVVKAAIITINTMTDWKLVDAYDAANILPWPEG